jgi:hypothetical protein
MTHACEQCGSTFERFGTRPYRFCGLGCYHDSMRGATKVAAAPGRMRKLPGHPLASKSGIFAVARLVLYEKIGPGTHPCHWCGSPVTWTPGGGPRHGALLADHLNWDRTDDSPQNLVPACTECNAHRTRQGDRRRIGESELVIRVGSATRTRAVERQCERCGATFLAIPALVRRGQARFCSRVCAWNRNHPV